MVKRYLVRVQHADINSVARSSYGTAGPPEYGDLSRAISRHNKAFKIARRDWGITLVTWNEYGGCPQQGGHVAQAHHRLPGGPYLAR